MKNRVNKSRTCPICGKEYKATPAISKADGITPICPECGIKESLDSLGISEEEKIKILNTIPKTDI